MLDNNNGKCPFTDEIVSYMYNEIGVVDAGVFESHLADCTVCTDEFAAISNARFSVYEWHKEEFVPLPTPQFVIPYGVRPSAEPAPGIFAGLRELFAFGRWPITVAATLAVAIGLGLFAMNYLAGGDGPVVANNIERPAETALSPKPEPDVAFAPPSVKRDIRTPANPAIQAVERRGAKVKQNPSPQKVNATKAVKKAPVLSPFDEDADTSLRLADLFDGIGG